MNALQQILQLAFNDRLTFLQGFYVVVFVLSMNHTFRTNAFHVTLEAVIEQLLIGMLLAVLASGLVVTGGCYRYL